MLPLITFDCRFFFSFCVLNIVCALETLLDKQFPHTLLCKVRVGTCTYTAAQRTVTPSSCSSAAGPCRDTMMQVFTTMSWTSCFPMKHNQRLHIIRSISCWESSFKVRLMDEKQQCIVIYRLHCRTGSYLLRRKL